MIGYLILLVITFVRKDLCSIFLAVLSFLWTHFQLYIYPVSSNFHLSHSLTFKICLTFQSIVQLMSYHCVIICHYRALDNQVYAGVSVARDESVSYVSWANYTLESPW